MGEGIKSFIHTSMLLAHQATNQQQHYSPYKIFTHHGQAGK